MKMKKIITYVQKRDCFKCGNAPIPDNRKYKYCQDCARDNEIEENIENTIKFVEKAETFWSDLNYEPTLYLDELIKDGVCIASSIGEICDSGDQIHYSKYEQENLISKRQIEEERNIDYQEREVVDEIIKRLNRLDRRYDL